MVEPDNVNAMLIELKREEYEWRRRDQKRQDRRAEDQERIRREDAALMREEMRLAQQRLENDRREARTFNMMMMAILAGKQGVNSCFIVFLTYPNQM